jgi:hypothetical protein
VEAANTAGGYDNITVVLTDVVTGPAASKQEPLARQKVSTPKTNNHTTSGGKKSFIAQNMLPIGVGLGLLLGGLLWLVLRSPDNSAAIAAAKAAAAFTKDSLREVKLARDRKDREEEAERERNKLPNSVGATLPIKPSKGQTDPPKQQEKPSVKESVQQAGQQFRDKDNAPPSGNPSTFDDKQTVKQGDDDKPTPIKAKDVFGKKEVIPQVSPADLKTKDATPIPKAPATPKKDGNHEKKK